MHAPYLILAKIHNNITTGLLKFMLNVFCKARKQKL